MAIDESIKELLVELKLLLEEGLRLLENQSKDQKYDELLQRIIVCETKKEEAEKDILDLTKTCAKVNEENGRLQEIIREISPDKNIEILSDTNDLVKTIRRKKSDNIPKLNINNTDTQINRAAKNWRLTIQHKYKIFDETEIKNGSDFSITYKTDRRARIAFKHYMKDEPIGCEYLRDGHDISNGFNEQLILYKESMVYMPYLHDIENVYQKYVAYICYINLMFSLTFVGFPQDGSSEESEMTPRMVRLANVGRVAYKQFMQVIKLYIDEKENLELDGFRLISMNKIIEIRSKIEDQNNLIDVLYSLSLVKSMNYSRDKMFSDGYMHGNYYIDILGRLLNRIFYNGGDDYNHGDYIGQYDVSKVYGILYSIRQLGDVYDLALYGDESKVHPDRDIRSFLGPIKLIKEMKIFDQKEYVLTNKDIWQCILLGLYVLDAVNNIAFMNLYPELDNGGRRESGIEVDTFEEDEDELTPEEIEERELNKRGIDEEAKKRATEHKESERNKDKQSMYFANKERTGIVMDVRFFKYKLIFSI